MKALLIFSLTLFWSLALDDFSSGHQLFTASLYEEIAVEDSNIVVSPFSLETVLALTQSGARDATAEQIRTTLYLPETEEETESEMKRILPTLQSDDYTLQTANKIYVQEGYAINEDFQKAATEVYQAGFANVDFVKNVEAAAEINKWVEEETNDKIHDLIAPEDLDEDTRLVLVNALYFQGTWLYPFDSKITRKYPFFVSTEESRDTDMMIQIAVWHNYYESEELDAKILELPFEGEDATMTFILPNENDGIKKLEQQRDRLFLAPKYTNTSVTVSLPRFKIETSIDFSETLQKMGVKKAFDPFQADFSGIAGEPGELYIDKVKQKTFIDVDENGVAAAAATAVEMPAFSAGGKPFKADHPFMFYIKVKDMILFEGRVLEP